MKKFLLIVSILGAFNAQAMSGGFPEETKIQRYKSKLKFLKGEKKQLEEKMRQRSLQLEGKMERAQDNLKIKHFLSSNFQTTHKDKKLLVETDTLAAWALRRLLKGSRLRESLLFFELSSIKCEDRPWLFFNSEMGWVNPIAATDQYAIGYGKLIGTGSGYKRQAFAEAKVTQDGEFLEGENLFYKYTSPGQQPIFVPKALFPAIAHRVRGVLLEAQLM